MYLALRSLLVAMLPFLISLPAFGAQRFRAIITHDQEVTNPPIPFEGSSGIGWFILSDDMTSLSYDITLFGLDIDGLQTPGDPDDNITRTHFHAALAGNNGGIVFGQIDPSPTLRNDLDDLMVDPVAGTIRGVWDGAEGNGTTLAAQLPNLLANGLYFNVHTSDHGGGEIRGQLVWVPEPSACWSAAMAIGACWWLRRRQK